MEMNDEQLKELRRKDALNELVNNYNITQIQNLNNSGYKYLSKHLLRNHFFWVIPS